MMDLGTQRAVVFQEHLPPLIVLLLVGSSSISGLLAGYTMAKRRVRSWLHYLAYAMLVALTIYTILDIDYPRFGLINIEDSHQPIYDLERSMP